MHLLLQNSYYSVIMVDRDFPSRQNTSLRYLILAMYSDISVRQFVFLLVYYLEYLLKLDPF